MAPISRKSAIITGGSRGLGLEVANRLATYGYNIAIAARDTIALRAAADAILDAGGMKDQGVLPIRADVTNGEDVAFMTRIAYSEFKRIDVLVCCSGVFLPRSEFLHESWATWRQMIDTNLTGTLLCCYEILPIMKDQGSGKIVTISGGGVGAMPTADMAVYTATKAGIVQFTESLGHELNGTGVEINSVAPGPIQIESSMEKAVDMIDFLTSDRSNGITGRFISAGWDLIVGIDANLSPDSYRLRRISRKPPHA